MGALNLFYDALDALWTTVEPRMATPEALLLLKQRTQSFLIDVDSSLNPLRQFATDELDSNRDRLATAVRELYEEGADELAAIELMFATPDTPEYTAMTDVLVRYIAVRDELDEDSSDSDSS
jgi:hypothetical protein